MKKFPLAGRKMLGLRSDIRNINVLAKFGAFGRTDTMGIYIYGKRRDGRTVVFKNEIQSDGSIKIWSAYDGGDKFWEEDMTEYTKDEWERIRRTDGVDAKNLANRILDDRSSS